MFFNVFLSMCVIYLVFGFSLLSRNISILLIHTDICIGQQQTGNY